MSRRRLLNAGCALWQKSSSVVLKNPVAFCASFATSSTQNEQKCCKEGQTCAAPNPAAAPLRHHHGSGKAKGEEALHKAGRSFCSTAPQIDHKTYLWARYNEMKRLVHGKPEGKSSFFARRFFFFFCSNTVFMSSHLYALCFVICRVCCV